MSFARYLCAVFCASSSLLLAVAPATAQDAYPNRPVKVIVALPAGGSVDMIARLVSQQLQTDLTIYELRSARGPVLAPPEGSTAHDGPLSDLITTAEGQRQTTDDARRRLDAMDNWSRRNDAGS